MSTLPSSVSDLQRALYLRKRALYLRKRALYLCQSALYPRKRAVDLRKRALIFTKQPYVCAIQDSLITFFFLMSKKSPTLPPKRPI